VHCEVPPIATVEGAQTAETRETLGEAGGLGWVPVGPPLPALSPPQAVTASSNTETANACRDWLFDNLLLMLRCKLLIGPFIQCT